MMADENPSIEEKQEPEQAAEAAAREIPQEGTTNEETGAGDDLNAQEDTVMEQFDDMEAFAENVSGSEAPEAEAPKASGSAKPTIAEQLEASGTPGSQIQKWFVVQVLSSHEKKVKKALVEQREHSGMNDLISEILLPTENVSEVKKGEQQVVEKRLWPGYLLVKMTMTDDSWSYVKGTPGVIDFLGGSQATPLTDQEVAEILADLEKKKNTRTQRHKFQVGDRVKIIDGVFVNFIGTVTEVFHDKGRLNALVNIFGRDTQVDDLDFTQVEETSDEEEANS